MILCSACRSVVLAGAFLLGAPSSGRAQSAALSGVVTDSAGRPIQHAKVVVEGADTVLTAADGSYAFATLPEGVFKVRAMFIGFLRAEKDSVRIKRGKIRGMMLLLKSQTCH